MVSMTDILSAHNRIKAHIVKTPVMTSTTLDAMTGAHVYLKCENFQRVGAFKYRGALNFLSQLTEEERARGVVTHSSGNHAQALALAARTLGIRATVVMPNNSPRVKLEATRGYGAEVVLCEPTLESREATVKSLIEERGSILVHPYNDERIIAGAGTATLELIDEVGPLNHVFAPVGGGGLLSGTAIAAKSLCPDCKVTGCEPANADDAYRSLKSGVIQPSMNPSTIADGLRTSLGPITFEVIRHNVDRIVRVTEEQILDAMRLLYERMKLVVEPSGAVALAGVLESSVKQELKDSRVGVIVSGGNVDLTAFFDSYSDRVRRTRMP
ncbi:MAG: pyridoxal-phosphate dependent enzyme [Candidatus Thorarchaeota archaeon]|nr:pyridoxal-phosphate dependent enzyme [Candidatus Thorarchaeota archaeon]